MTRLAFRVASSTGGAVARGIERVTHGPYSHVELWLSGAQNQALCYSSREPLGTGFATVDLSDAAVWAIVPVALTPAQETALEWFCRGSAGRPYDFAGIVGIGLDTRAHCDFQRFCSEACYEALQVTAGLWPHGPARWHVAPSGFQQPGDRAGLYELATGRAS